MTDSATVPPPSTPPAADQPAVRLSHIRKAFPGVVANRDITMDVAPGTVHAVVGENGAGKSTLMKILYGMQKQDSGTIEIGGQQVRFRSPSDAIAAGVGMVHQHFMLADNLTVAENIVLGAEPRRRWFTAGRLDRAQADRRIRQISDAYGLGLDPDALVEDLGVGARQRVEIAKVLFRGAKVLILDEPTAVLVPQEVDELFANLAELRAEGLTVLFISHKLDEVLTVADAVTVVRAGETVATVDPAQTSARELASLMVGGDLPVPAKRDSTVTDTVQLAVDGLTVRLGSGRPVLDDVSLAIRRGEILGIAGVEGNGQDELIEALLGLLPASSGRITFGGDDITGWGTGRRRKTGIGFIPSDRHRQGLLLSEPLWVNRILGHQRSRPNARGPLIDRRGARSDTQRIMAESDVRAPSCDTPAFALSGGNQQKLIVGREMSGDPSLLLAAHPTRGVDVGAQAAIWEQLREARAAGLAVLLVSADLEELIGMSDTLVVMLRGRLVATMDPTTVTPEELGAAMTGADGAAA